MHAPAVRAWACVSRDPNQYRSTSRTASAKACGASCGRLCSMPPVITRCAYGMVTHMSSGGSPCHLAFGRFCLKWTMPSRWLRFVCHILTPLVTYLKPANMQPVDFQKPCEPHLAVFRHRRQRPPEPAAITAIGAAVTQPTRRWVPRRLPIQGLYHAPQRYRASSASSALCGN